MSRDNTARLPPSPAPLPRYPPPRQGPGTGALWTCLAVGPWGPCPQGESGLRTGRSACGDARGTEGAGTEAVRGQRVSGPLKEAGGPLETRVPSVSSDMLGDAVSPPIPIALPALKCLGRRPGARRAGVLVRRLPPASSKHHASLAPEVTLASPRPPPSLSPRGAGPGQPPSGPRGPGGARAGGSWVDSAVWSPRAPGRARQCGVLVSLHLCASVCVFPKPLCSCLELTRTSPCALASMGLSA